MDEDVKNEAYVNDTLNVQRHASSLSGKADPKGNEYALVNNEEEASNFPGCFAGGVGIKQENVLVGLCVLSDELNSLVIELVFIAALKHHHIVFIQFHPLNVLLCLHLHVVLLKANGLVLKLNELRLKFFLPSRTSCLL